MNDEEKIGPHGISLTEAAAEREKYRRVWADPTYRLQSPGVRDLLDPFVLRTDLKRGQSLIDFGAGTGRASMMFFDLGMRVEMVDITKAAMDDLVIGEVERNRGLNFHEAPMWALPESLEPADWVFCADVLEHIPPQRLEECMDAMASLTILGGAIQVACFEDYRGGVALHLSINPMDWWTEQINKRWHIKKIGGTDMRPQYVMGGLKT